MKVLFVQARCNRIALHAIFQFQHKIAYKVPNAFTGIILEVCRCSGIMLLERMYRLAVPVSKHFHITTTLTTTSNFGFISQHALSVDSTLNLR